MPTISSRTPEGQPGRCPLCGAQVAIQPADPLGDAPCPACGMLLWPLAHADGQFLLVADELSTTQRERLRQIEARFQQGDLDSLDRVELVMEFEEAFGLEIPDDVAEKIKSIEDFLDWWLGRRKDDSDPLHQNDSDTS